MMYATCAKIGCYKKIEYNPDFNKPRPRYCWVHMGWEDPEGEEPGDNPNMALWILPTRIRNVSQITLVHQQKFVELRCPLCKLRITVPESKTGYKQACKTYGCEGTMIYHKDVMPDV